MATKKTKPDCTITITVFGDDVTTKVHYTDAPKNTVFTALGILEAAQQTIISATRKGATKKVIR